VEDSRPRLSSYVTTHEATLLLCLAVSLFTVAGIASATVFEKISDA